MLGFRKSFGALGVLSNIDYPPPVIDSWDITTAISAGGRYSGTVITLTAESAAQGLCFKSDGTSFYMIGSTTDTVYQYNMSTAWDINTATYSGKSLLISAQESSPTSVQMKNDGTSMYITGSGNDSVRQYNLSTAWDLSTATYSSKTFSVASQESSPTGIYFKTDGTSFFMVGSGTRLVREYTMTTAWDVSSSSYSGKTFNLSTQDTSPQEIIFNSNGTSFYMIGQVTDNVYQYNMSTAWDITSASYTGVTYAIGTEEPNPYAIALSDSGVNLYVMGNARRILQYTLSTPWDISTGPNAVKGPGYMYAATYDSNPTDFVFGDNGSKVYIIGNTTDKVYQYSLSTPWDLSSSTYDSKTVLNSPEGVAQDVVFNNDGTLLYIIGTGGDSVYQFAMSTAWDISTAVYTNKSILISAQETNTTALFFKPDGKAFYILGTTNDSVRQFSLSTAWDVSTATYTNKTYSITNQEGSPQDIFFKPDGTAFFMTGSTNDLIRRYNLSTAWDISTASNPNISFNVAPYDNNPVSLYFNDSGTKMYMLGLQGKSILQFNLS